MESLRHSALLNEYNQVADNFRTLTDIRFKLLAFIPFATVAVMSEKTQEMHGFVLSFFGLIVTIALAIYNERNDQLYNALIGRASEIERTLGLPDGAFANRPTSWLILKILGVKFKIDHGTGVGVIYIASITAWLYGCYLPIIEKVSQFYLSFSDINGDSIIIPVISKNLLAFSFALLSISFVLITIKGQRETREEKMRELAASAVSQLESLEINRAAENFAFIDTCSELSGIKKEKIQARARFYACLDKTSLLHYMSIEPKGQSMSQFVSLLTDLPPSWIYDCFTNRRGAVNPVSK